MREIAFVQATVSDVPAFIALQEQSTDRKLWGPIGGPAEALREIGENTLLLLKDGDETIGSVAYRTRADRSVYISNVIVVPAARGKGYARLVLSYVLEMNKAASRVDLVTHPDNEGALRLYQSLGFAVESCKENYFGDGEPRLILVRTEKG